MGVYDAMESYCKSTASAESQDDEEEPASKTVISNGRRRTTRGGKMVAAAAATKRTNANKGKVMKARKSRLEQEAEQFVSGKPRESVTARSTEVKSPESPVREAQIPPPQAPENGGGSVRKSGRKRRAAQYIELEEDDIPRRASTRSVKTERFSPKEIAKIMASANANEERSAKQSRSSSAEQPKTKSSRQSSRKLNMDQEETEENGSEESSGSNRKRGPSRKLTTGYYKETSLPASQDDEDEDTRPKRGRQSSYSNGNKVKEEILSPTSMKSAALALRPRKQPPKVMFTGIIDKTGEAIVLDLGGSLTNNVAECTHLITEKVRRTVKFLCACVRGIPILSLEWLRDSRMEKRFLNEADYCLAINSPSQLELEAKYDFHFPMTLALSRTRKEPLFSTLRIHITPSVQPPPDQMYQIIQVGGGKPLHTLPKSRVKKSWANVIVVTNREDVGEYCELAYKMNVPVVSKEYILTGVLRQKLESQKFAMSQLRDIKATAKAKMIEAEKRKSRASLGTSVVKQGEPRVDPEGRPSSTPKPSAPSTRTRRNIKTPAKYKDDIV